MLLILALLNRAILFFLMLMTLS